MRRFLVLFLLIFFFCFNCSKNSWAWVPISSDRGATYVGMNKPKGGCTEGWGELSAPKSKCVLLCKNDQDCEGKVKLKEGQYFECGKGVYALADAGQACMVKSKSGASCKKDKDCGEYSQCYQGICKQVKLGDLCDGDKTISLKGENGKLARCMSGKFYRNGEYCYLSSGKGCLGRKWCDLENGEQAEQGSDIYKCSSQVDVGQSCIANLQCKDSEWYPNNPRQTGCVKTQGKKGKCTYFGLEGEACGQPLVDGGTLGCKESELECRNGKCKGKYCPSGEKITNVDNGCICRGEDSACAVGNYCIVDKKVKDPSMNVYTTYFKCVNEEEYKKSMDKPCPTPYAQVSEGRGERCELTADIKLQSACKCNGTLCAKGSYCAFLGYGNEAHCKTKEEMKKYLTEQCIGRCLGGRTPARSACRCGSYSICQPGEICDGGSCIREKTLGTCDYANIIAKYAYNFSDPKAIENNCYSCLIVKTLTETFLAAAAKVYIVSQNAGVKILLLGFVLWLALYMLKTLSQVTSLEPANMLDQILKMSFKIALAYLGIVIGAKALCDYMVAPFMLFGTNFANQLLQGSGSGMGEAFLEYGEDDWGDVATPEENAAAQQNAEQILEEQKEAPKDEEIPSDATTLAEKLTKGFLNKVNDNVNALINGPHAQYDNSKHTKKVTKPKLENRYKVFESKMSDSYCAYGISRSLTLYLRGICDNNKNCIEKLNFLNDAMYGSIPLDGRLKKNDINGCIHVYSKTNSGGKSFTSIGAGSGWILATKGMGSSGYHASIVDSGSRYLAFNGEHSRNQKIANHKDETYVFQALDSKCAFEKILQKYPELENLINMGNVDKSAAGDFSFSSTSNGGVSSSCQDYVSNLASQGMGMLENAPGGDLANRSTDLASGARVWVGDSRFVGLKPYKQNKDIFIAETGEGCKWLKSTAMPQLNNLVNNDIVVFGLGVNDISNSDCYKEAYKKIAQAKPNVKFYITEVAKVGANYKYKSLTAESMNQQIETFNKAMSNFASGVSNITYKSVGLPAADADDNLHYTSSTYKSNYNKISNAIGMPEASSATETPTPTETPTETPAETANVAMSINAPMNVPEMCYNQDRSTYTMGKAFPMPSQVKSAIATESSGKINPVIVAAVVNTESNCNPLAGMKGHHYNPCCKGLMQIMHTKYKVWQEYSGHKNVNINDPNDPIYNPNENVRAGIKLLLYQYKRYGNNIEYALAAYNAGNANSYKRWKAGGGTASSAKTENQKYAHVAAAYYQQMTGGQALFDAAVSNSAATIGSYGGNPCDSAFIPNTPLGKITYSGDTTVLSASVINSMIRALAAINGEIAKLQILGNMITCFASHGGAWIAPEDTWFEITIPDIFTWFVGAVIWVAGFMLIMAVAYYFLDISFKIGFAVIALPVCIGLWPFNITKGKIAMCLSIIMKGAATFAFLAITANYSMFLVKNVLESGVREDQISYENLMQAMENANLDSGSIFEVTSGETTSDERKEGKKNEDNALVNQHKTNVEIVKERVGLFTKYFILILFALVYSFKMIGTTVKDLVDKFFPDQMFGNQNPMHSKLTAATKYVKDLAMKPGGLARDIAMHQTGRLAKGTVKKTAGAIAHPVRTAKNIGSGVKKAASKISGKMGGKGDA